MFITVDEAELCFQGIFEDKGARCWSFIEQPICRPWFYIQLRKTDEDGIYSQMLMLDTIKGLDELLSSPYAKNIILKISYVYPKFEGHVILWEINEIINVKRMKGSDGSANLMVTTADGKEYPPLIEMLSDGMQFDGDLYIN